ncbi:MAG: hypothetical protein KJ064_27465 [Anaerolineae bacterium]|nr:hypothetical protein [Anaerolineae bacterium]
MKYADIDTLLKRHIQEAVSRHSPQQLLELAVSGRLQVNWNLWLRYHAYLKQIWWQAFFRESIGWAVLFSPCMVVALICNLVTTFHPAALLLLTAVVLMFVRFAYWEAQQHKSRNREQLRVRRQPQPSIAHWIVQREAIRALGTVQTPHVTAALIELYPQKNTSNVSGDILDALYQGGSEDGLAFLKEILRTSTRHSHWALSLLPPTREVLEIATRRLGERQYSNPEDFSAPPILGQLEKAKAYDLLMEAAQQGTAPVRHKAAVILGKVNCEAAIPVLIKLLEDDGLGSLHIEEPVNAGSREVYQSYVWQAARNALRKMKPAALLMLTPLLEHSDEKLRKRAASVIDETIKDHDDDEEEEDFY